MTDKPVAVSTGEATILLGCSRTTIRRLIQRGSLTAYRLTLAKNSPHRITTASIDKVLSERMVRLEYIK